VLNKNLTRRPVHGIHISLNRENPNGTDSIPGWGHMKYEEQWKLFSNSELYKKLEKSFSPLIKEQIEKLENAYEQ
jgi:hypothetical protein